MIIPLGLLALAAIVLVLIVAATYYLCLGIWMGGKHLVHRYRNRQTARQAAIEAELDRTQDELRLTILHLADELGNGAHEARRALIRESFRANGKLPPPGH